VFLEARWRDPKGPGSDVVRSSADTLHMVWSQGAYTPDDIRPLADMFHEHFGPRGIPYRFQRDKFVTTDFNPVIASHSTPITQSNNYG
jgi:hypothetical protein